MANLDVSLGGLESSDPIIDIDIVFYGDEEISTPNLTIPHYDWKNRDFFIACLEEISCPFVEGNGLSLKKVKKLV